MKTFEDLKPTSQGTLGVGVAIGYYSSIGYIVSIPLSDNQKYDLLVDENTDDTIKKTQVKTTRYKKKGLYQVQLKTVCPKKTSKNRITPFDNTKVDYVFVVCEDGTLYNIPSKKIKAKTTLSLNSEWDKYKVK